MRGRVWGAVGLLVALALPAGCTLRGAPGGSRPPSGSPTVRLTPSMWGLTGQDLVDGSFRELGRTDYAVAVFWSLPNGRWCVGLAGPSGDHPSTACVRSVSPVANPPGTKVMSSAALTIWTALFTVDGEEPLDLRCWSWSARLFDLGEVPGQDGPRRVYLAMDGHAPLGDPLLQVRRGAGTAVERLPNWGRVPGPDPVDCG